MSHFHCAKFKKHFQSQFRVSGMCHFWVRNDPFALNTFVLVQTMIITIIYLLELFSVENFKKNSSSSSRVMRTHHFWIQNSPFAPNNLFFGKKLWTLFSYIYWPLLLWKILKKFFQRDPELWGCTIFWAINGSFATMRVFFRKPVNKPCSFHSCLHSCQISNSDDDLLKKYWWLKNTEISLTKKHFRL